MKKIFKQPSLLLALLCILLPMLLLSACGKQTDLQEEVPITELTESKPEEYTNDIELSSFEELDTQESTNPAIDISGVINSATAPEESVISINRLSLPAIAGQVVQVETDESYSQFAVLRADGTVRVLGDNTYGQCDVAHWENVVKIWADTYITFGLTKDGKILATNGLYSEWTNVADLFIERNYNLDDSNILNPAVFAVKVDGSIVATGCSSNYGNNLSMYDFYGWENTKDIQMYFPYSEWVIGLRGDGAVCILNHEGKEVEMLTNIKSINKYDGSNRIYAISNDGKVYEMRSDPDNKNGTHLAFKDMGWENVESITLGYADNVYGITNSGTILCGKVDADGFSLYQEEALLKFQDISMIGVGERHRLVDGNDYTAIMCLKEDGSTTYYPADNFGDMRRWENIIQMKSYSCEIVVAQKSDGSLLFGALSGEFEKNTYDWGNIADFWLVSDYENLYLIALTEDGEFLRTVVAIENDFPVEELDFLTADVKS